MKLLKRIYARLKQEPAMIAAAISMGLGWLTTHGFELDETQTAFVWMAISLVFGVGVRQVVTPTSKA